MIERKINITTRTNETGGVTIASMKSPAMNIEINVKTLKRGHRKCIRSTFLSATTIKTPKLKMIRVFDENSIPITRIAIQTIENMKVPIAVIGSIPSLCSSVYLYFQDGGENLSGNLAQLSNLCNRCSIDF